MGLWYGVEDGYLQIQLHDGSVLLMAACWEGCHLMVDVPRGRVLTCRSAALAQRPHVLVDEPLEKRLEAHAVPEL